MRLLDMVVGDAVADPDAHSASVFGVAVIHHSSGLRRMLKMTSMLSDDEVGFHDK